LGGGRSSSPSPSPSSSSSSSSSSSFSCSCSISLLLDRRGRCLDIVGQPGQTLEKTLAVGRARGHDVPDLVLELGELQRLGDFLRCHGYKGVSKHEERGELRGGEGEGQGKR
jgi:hypothetical protein